MLTVLLIIVVLATLMFPVFRGAKSKAKQTVCLSNMRQLYTAMKLYQGDYDEYPPNLATFEGFTSYCPKPLFCPESKFMDRPVMRSLDYIMMGSPEYSGLIRPDEAAKALSECRLKREGQIPVIRDQNHVASSIQPGDKNSLYILARENGKIEFVPAARASPVEKDCDETVISRFYNY
jgi:hypothetical protein